MQNVRASAVHNAAFLWNLPDNTLIALAAKGSPDGGALRQRQRSQKATSRNDGFMQE
jgi:hypothetical protein